MTRRRSPAPVQVTPDELAFARGGWSANTVGFLPILGHNDGPCTYELVAVVQRKPFKFERRLDREFGSHHSATPPIREHVIEDLLKGGRFLKAVCTFRIAPPVCMVQCWLSTKDTLAPAGTLGSRSPRAATSDGAFRQ